MELLAVLKDGGDLSTVAGLSYRENGKIRHNAPRQLTPLTRFPTLPYHKVPLEQYIHRNYIGSRTLDYNSSFGCPFACNFCAIVSMTDRGWLPEPPERVAGQLKMLRDRFGVNGILFHDMDFFVSEKRVAEICDRIKDFGLAWWALDYPFLERTSSAQKDIETTMRACEKFKTFPVSIMNFVEGTRFTAEKHREQRSPYSRLLKPKAGGIAFVLAAMGEQLDSILDVTIAYPEGAEGFWAFLCGRVTEIKVRVKWLPITEELTGDYFKDREFRKRFMRWLNALWVEKDRRLAALLNEES